LRCEGAGREGWRDEKEGGGGSWIRRCARHPGRLRPNCIVPCNIFFDIHPDATNFALNFGQLHEMATNDSFVPYNILHHNYNTKPLSEEGIAKFHRASILLVISVSYYRT